MKKTVLAIILLLLALTFSGIPTVSATKTEERWVTPALPCNVPCKLMPENYTTEDYLNTTNPYANYPSNPGPIDEVDEPEGNYPIYVLLFGDEEERQVIRHIGPEGQYPVDWKTWAELQLERGDEALVANFGIDIRILGFLEWDSDDSIQRMDDPEGFDLCDELLAEKGHYLRTWYSGEWWSDYVDAIIGITDQATPEDPSPIAGVSPGLNELDQGIIFVLLKWQVYWADDNLVQHEVSHLYCAPDHIEPCCAMAYHAHFQLFIYEDGTWWVFAYVPCCYTSYDWCASCHQTIRQNIWRYIPPVCAMKTMADGYFYVPEVTTNRLLKIEMLFDNSRLVGDQTGGTSPYSTIAAYPDGKVNINDVYLISKYFGKSEPYADVNAYMADVVPNRKIDINDVYAVNNNFGKTGTYITVFSGVTITFDTGQTLSPDNNGFIPIPSGATSFTVKRDGNPIGAMIFFW